MTCGVGHVFLLQVIGGLLDFVSGHTESCTGTFDSIMNCAGGLISGSPLACEQLLYAAAPPLWGADLLEIVDLGANRFQESRRLHGTAT